LRFDSRGGRRPYGFHQLADAVSTTGAYTKAIALDLARDVALKTAGPFPAIGERAAGLYDEDPPIWYEYRHRVMNQRPCDHEERGIWAWKIA
jgi:hypothetical protein